MSLVRITLTLFASIVASGSAVAQDFDPPGIFVERNVQSGSVGYIQDAIDSLDLDKPAKKQTGGDHVVTNLLDHPVHAMRRRRPLEQPLTTESLTEQQKALERLFKTARPKTLINAAKEIGLHGQWYVLSSEKDGYFSKAQIGQQPGDVITMSAKEENEGQALLSMG